MLYNLIEQAVALNLLFGGARDGTPALIHMSVRNCTFGKRKALRISWYEAKAKVLCNRGKLVLEF